MTIQIEIEENINGNCSNVIKINNPVKRLAQYVFPVTSAYAINDLYWQIKIVLELSQILNLSRSKDIVRQ